MNDSGNPHGSFDWYRPDYRPVWAERVRRLAKLRADKGLLEATKVYYRDAIADFINDWGVTVDQRNAGRPGFSVIMPFVLFPQQREFVNWVLQRFRKPEDGILVKSRDCGASWMAFAIADTVCSFWEDVSIGFGSATEDKVDKSGDPDSLFYKGRTFVQYMPPEYRPNWDLRKHSSHMTLMFPWTGSSITGGAGDRIGRGGRKTIWFVDEFAFVERPQLVDANLIAATDCRIEMSSVQGIANVFAERARGGLIPRFDFDYHDDPRKVDPITRELRPEFAEKKRKTDPTIWAAEYERDFLASAEGIIIPQEWVQAAIGAAAKLGIEVTGEKRAAYDVADKGKDKNCFGSTYGVELQFIESWAGTNSTIYKSVEKVHRMCDERQIVDFDYDADGMGAGVEGDAQKISEERETAALPIIRAHMFRGSGAVQDPENLCPGTTRTNKDFFENYKAQCWWSLRQRFRATWEAVTNGAKFDPSEIVSINPALPELTKTCSELSQPVWTWSKSGKMMIDKTPDDVASPNNGDTVMMLYPYARPGMLISDAILEMFGNAPDQQQD